MINPMDLSERNILVTGASNGIGRETSILLSQLGARVILVARREDALKDTLSKMTDSDPIVTFILAIVARWIMEKTLEVDREYMA